MKKKLWLSALILALITAIAVFSGCGGGETYVTTELLKSDVNVVVIKADETKDGAYLSDALYSLKADGKLDYVVSEGTYGLFVESVNGHAANSQNEYWAIYTSLADYSSTEFGGYEYEGVLYGYALVGVSSLPIIEGEIYILVFTSY